MITRLLIDQAPTRLLHVALLEVAFVYEFSVVPIHVCKPREPGLVVLLYFIWVMKKGNGRKHL